MNKKLRICHIGWANSIHVERMMVWFAKKGHNNSIITNNPKKIPGVKVYDLRRKPDLRPRKERYKDFHFNVNWKWLYGLNEIVRIRRLVEEISPDIVHSHSLWYPGYLGIYIKGYPYVITVLNGDVLWKRNRISIYKKIRTKWALKRADQVTGESVELINACIKHGVDRNKVLVTRGWGVDFTKFNFDGNRTEIRKKLGLPENSKIVLSPRNTGWYYNLDKIVKTIPKVKREFKDVIFLFIWHGHNSNKENELAGLAHQLGIQDYVKIIGFVDHDRVALYHKASDVMVSVSQYDSGPVALQEAMACGDAPVMSDLACVKEWITDDYNGLLVNPNNINQIADSIIDLLGNEKKRMSFAKRNWELIQEKGNQNYWLGKLEELYYSFL